MSCTPQIVAYLRQFSELRTKTLHGVIDASLTDLLAGLKALEDAGQIRHRAGRWRIA